VCANRYQLAEFAKQHWENPLLQLGMKLIIEAQQKHAAGGSSDDEEPEHSDPN